MRTRFHSNRRQWLQQQQGMLRGLLQNGPLLNGQTLPREIVDAAMSVIATGFFLHVPVLVTRGEAEGGNGILIEIHGPPSESRLPCPPHVGNGASQPSKYVSLTVRPEGTDDRVGNALDLPDNRLSLAVVREVVDVLEKAGFALNAYKTNGPRITEVTLCRLITSQAQLVLEVTVRA